MHQNTRTQAIVLQCTRSDFWRSSVWWCTKVLPANLHQTYTRTTSLAYFDAPRSWPWNCAKIVQKGDAIEGSLTQFSQDHKRSTKTHFAFSSPNIDQEAWSWFHQASLHHQISFATPVCMHILGAPWLGLPWLGVTLVKYVWSVLFTCRLPAAPPFTSWYIQHEIYDMLEDRNAHLKVF